MNDINKMPPKCQYCPYWEVCKYPWVCPDIGDKKPETHDKRTETHACDLISRQVAIDALDKRFDSIPMEQTTEILQLRKDLRELPSAQSERKTVDLKIEKISKHQSDFSDLDAQPKTHDKRSETHASDLISRQTAIDIVNKYKKSHMILWGKPMVGAASIVIELEELPPVQPETHDKRTETHACDCIERQAAIDALEQAKEQYFDRRVIIGKMQDVVSNLPSAQPEPCEDAVSRKAVEEMLKNEFPARGMWEIEGDVVKETVCEMLVDALMGLEKLPSVTPKRKTGRWLDNYQYGYKCSECGAYLEIDCGDAEMNFCPNCGADMRGEQE